MSRSIFFIHRGSIEIARYAVFHAASIGLDVHVIGDRNWADYSFLAWHDIADLGDVAASFLAVYRHVSINDTAYERFCFERWFMIRAVARAHNLNRFYYADSDLLVFPSAFMADFENRFEMFDTAWFNFFRDISVLDRFCDFLIDIYNTGEARDLAEKYAIDGRPHLSDMHCIFEYGARMRTRVAPLSSLGPFLGFDERFSNTQVIEAADSSPFVQKIIRDGERLQVKLRHSGELVPSRTLHFQGRSKPFIQAYHKVRDPGLLAALDDLSGWYAANKLLHDAECATMADALSDAMRAARDDGARQPRFDPPALEQTAYTGALGASSGDKGMNNETALLQLRKLADPLSVEERNHILGLLKLYDFRGAAAEIGTFNGTFANELLQHTAIAKLSCVDPYSAYEDFRDAINEMDMEVHYNQAKSFLKPFGDRVEFIRQFSADAARTIPDGSLDFVYIDGNHQAAYVLQDLQAWWPKVRPGGLVIGDDCADTDDAARNAAGDVTLVHHRKDDGSPDLYGDYGVLFALRNFAANMGLGYIVVGSQFVIPH